MATKAKTKRTAKSPAKKTGRARRPFGIPFAKPLSAAERRRRVATQTLWVLVDRFTGDVMSVALARVAARKLRTQDDVLERVDVVVRGARA